MMEDLVPETAWTLSHSEHFHVYQRLDSSQNALSTKERCAAELMDEVDQSGRSWELVRERKGSLFP